MAYRVTYLSLGREMIIKLELDLNFVNVALQALSEIPFKTSAPVIQEIQRQAQEQMKPQAVPDQAAEATSE